MNLGLWGSLILGFPHVGLLCKETTDTVELDFFVIPLPGALPLDDAIATPHLHVPRLP